MKKLLLFIFAMILLCGSVFFGVKSLFFKDFDILEPIKSIRGSNVNFNEKGYVNAVTKPIEKESEFSPFGTSTEDVIESNYVDNGVYPYSVAPEIYDDGSIVYDGLTVTELTNKLNKSLGSYLTNTGYFFADYTRKTGLDPYLAVAIVLLETGCKYGCSGLTTSCNNIGGLKFHGSCNGTSYSKYDTLEDGIKGYLGIVYNYYYSQGLRTPEQMNPKYAESCTWAFKVNKYIDEIKSK
jgi:hypothetical protein